jgi:hypothetical protein
VIVAQWLALFVVGVLCALGTATGVGRGFAAPLGVATWFVLANASTDLTVYSGGAEFTASSPPLFWLFVAIGAVHLIGVLITIDEFRSDSSDSQADPLQQMNARQERLLGSRETGGEHE